jgi:alpha-L-fucosidase
VFRLSWAYLSASAGSPGDDRSARAGVNQYYEVGTVAPPGLLIRLHRAEGDESIAPDELIYLLVDIVSKNGNLLLDVGPEADGTIPTVQMERLQALGAWRKQNGAAIYGTQPWARAEGETAQGMRVRFTRTDSAVGAILLGKPKTGAITIKSLSPKPLEIFMVGSADPLTWSQQGSDMRIHLPSTLAGEYAYVLKIAGPVL